MSYKNVYIDISGYCNAMCRWCVTYNERHIQVKRRFLSPYDFSKILLRLIKIRAVDGSTIFNLHNWGEPSINKDFSNIIDILTRNSFNWGFSTNASIFPNIQNNDFSLLKSLTISMPGFSQASYDIIHGFNFNGVLGNINNYVTLLGNFSGRILIHFHVYQFNLGEIIHAHAYASGLNVRFHASCAFINNITNMIRYLQGILSEKDLYDASKTLLLFYVNDLISTMPQDYVCPQLSYLTLDEFGNVLQCCALSRTHKYYSIGSIFDLTLDEIIENRKKSPACGPCLDSGAAYWAHNPRTFDYFSILKKQCNASQ